MYSFYGTHFYITHALYNTVYAIDFCVKSSGTNYSKHSTMNEQTTLLFYNINIPSHVQREAGGSHARTHAPSNCWAPKQIEEVKFERGKSKNLMKERLLLAMAVCVEVGGSALLLGIWWPFCYS